ncbi:MAG: Ada metal-binding domain-containing protein [Syntrophobacteraceae bacterium]
MKKKLSLICLFLFLLAVPLLAAQNVGNETEYHGNVHSRVFHRPSCRYFNCANCTKVFKTREDAIADGYRPCRVCNP